MRLGLGLLAELALEEGFVVGRSSGPRSVAESESVPEAVPIDVAVPFPAPQTESVSDNDFLSCFVWDHEASRKLLRWSLLDRSREPTTTFAWVAAARIAVVAWPLTIVTRTWIQD